MDTKHVASTFDLKATSKNGDVTAVFSTFDVIDSDGDVVLASAFTDGQEVPLVWSHDWTKPVGRGVIRVEPDRAIFDGRFFLDTQTGTEAYRTAKGMSDLQELSWGFRVLKSEMGEKDGRRVRFIQEAEVFEVSLVLVGANRETGLLAIKTAAVALGAAAAAELGTAGTAGAGAETSARTSGDADNDPDATPDPEPSTEGLLTEAEAKALRGSYEARIEALTAALMQQFAPNGEAFVMPVATYNDAVVCAVFNRYEDAPIYYRVPYRVTRDGSITLDDPQAVEQAFVPVGGKGLPLLQHIERVLADALAVKGRSRSLADLRLAEGKEGRAISTARRSRLEKTVTALREAADDIAELLEETAPKAWRPSTEVEALKIRSEFDRIRARIALIRA